MQAQTHEECIKLLNEWVEYCQLQTEMHASARGHYKRLHKLIFIPASLLGGLSGVSSITNSMTEKLVVVGIVFGCMSLASITLFALHNNFGIAEKQELHSLYGDAFFNLQNEIKVNLTLESSEDRGYRTIGEFVKHCKHRLEIIIDKAPSIPGGVAKAHSHKVKRTNSVKSIIVDCC
jgi:hypothetical protein